MNIRTRKEKLFAIIDSMSNYLVIATDDLIENDNQLLKYEAKNKGLKCMMFVKRMFDKYHFNNRKNNQKLSYINNKHIFLVSVINEQYNYLSFIKLSKVYKFSVVGAVVDKIFYRDYHFIIVCNYDKNMLIVLMIGSMATYIHKIIASLIYFR